MAAISTKFNSVKITGAQDWREVINSRVNETIIPRRDGTVCETYPKLESRSVVVSGILSSTSATSTRALLDTLQSNLNVGAAALTQFDDRQLINVVKRNFDYKWYRNGNLVEYQIEFICPDPYYYATSTSTDTANTTSPTTTALTSGTGLTYPAIEITASGGSITAITLTNTYSTINAGFTYSGTIASTKKLTVNCYYKTVSNDGTSDLNNFEGEFFPLVCGQSNVITISKTGAGTYSIDFTWYSTWV